MPPLRSPKSSVGLYYKYPNNHAYIIGGHDYNNLETAECERFDVFNKKMDALPDLN